MTRFRTCRDPVVRIGDHALRRVDTRRRQRAVVRDDALVEIGQTGAIDAVSALLGPLPAGHHVIATPAPGTLLWWVGPSDENGMPYAGAGYLVGPDAQVWTISSNGAIHDSQLAVRLLDATYRERLEDYLTPQKFADRLRAMTADRVAAEREFLVDLRAGALREVPDRRLP
jgi:hypothetical protein